MQRRAIVVAQPNRTGDPIAAGRNGLDKERADFGERQGAGEQAGDGVLRGPASLLLDAARDVAADFGSADDAPVLVFYRRNRERNIEQRSILAPADGLVMLERSRIPRSSL